MTPAPGVRRALARRLAVGLLALLLGWGTVALVSGGMPASSLGTFGGSGGLLSRARLLNLAWVASLGAPVHFEPAAGDASGGFGFRGAARIAWLPSLLVSAVALLVAGALLARWEGCRTSREALLAGGSAAVPVALLAGLFALAPPPPLEFSLGDLGRWLQGVAIRPLDAVGTVLACGMVAGATGGVLARPRSGGVATDDAAWSLLERALRATFLLAVLSVPAGILMLLGLGQSPEIQASLDVARRSVLDSRGADLLTVGASVAGQPLTLVAGAGVRGDMVVAPGDSGAAPGRSGEAVGAATSGRVHLCSGLRGGAPLVFPAMMRGGALLSIGVAVLVGRRSRPLARRRERLGLALVAAIVLAGAVSWLSSWCDLAVGIPGALPGLRLWAWWRADGISLLGVAPVFGVAMALAAPRPDAAESSPRP